MLEHLYQATAEAFAGPRPGDRFHEMYSWWVVVVTVGPDGVKTMSAGGPTNVTRGRFPDGEIVEPFPDRATVRWFATADDFRAAFGYRPGHPGYTIMLADRGKVDVTGWLDRARELPAAPRKPPEILSEERVRDLQEEERRLRARKAGIDERLHEITRLLVASGEARLRQQATR